MVYIIKYKAYCLFNYCIYNLRLVLLVLRFINYMV